LLADARRGRACATSTKVSVSGPKGVTTSQVPAAAAKSKTRKAASRSPAAPELFFFLLFRLRLTIQALSTLRTAKNSSDPPRGFPTYDCIGGERHAGIAFSGFTEAMPSTGIVALLSEESEEQATLKVKG